MAKSYRFIAPERMGTWVVVTLGVALLSLLLAVVGIRNANLAAAVSQVEVIKLNQRIKALEMKKDEPAPAPAAPAQNEMPAK